MWLIPPDAGVSTKINRYPFSLIRLAPSSSFIPTLFSFSYQIDICELQPTRAAPSELPLMFLAIFKQMVLGSLSSLHTLWFSCHANGPTSHQLRIQTTYDFVSRATIALAPHSQSHVHNPRGIPAPIQYPSHRIPNVFSASGFEPTNSTLS